MASRAIWPLQCRPQPIFGRDALLCPHARKNPTRAHVRRSERCRSCCVMAIRISPGFTRALSAMPGTPRRKSIRHERSSSQNVGGRENSGDFVIWRRPYRTDRLLNRSAHPVTAATTQESSSAEAGPTHARETTRNAHPAARQNPSTPSPLTVVSDSVRTTHVICCPAPPCQCVDGWSQPCRRATSARTFCTRVARARGPPLRSKHQGFAAAHCQSCRTARQNPAPAAAPAREPMRRHD